jgi:hypothetical protein
VLNKLPPLNHMDDALRDAEIVLFLKTGETVAAEWVEHWTAWSPQGGPTDREMGMGYQYDRRIKPDQVLGWWPMPEVSLA